MEKLNQPTHIQSNTAMSTQSYSRQYLRELPENQRRMIIENDVFRLFQQMIRPLKAAALKGETRYLHDMTHWVAQQGQIKTLQATHRLSPKEAQFHQQVMACHERQGNFHAESDASIDELLAALKEKFPDCGVSFQEDWVETRQGVKELKKGILIDWS